MRGFLGEFGRKFYGEPESKAKIKVVSNEEMVVESLSMGMERIKWRLLGGLFFGVDVI